MGIFCSIFIVGTLIVLESRAVAPRDHDDPLLGFEKAVRDMQALRDREAIRALRVGRFAYFDRRYVSALERRARRALRGQLESVAANGEWWSLPKALYASAAAYRSLLLLFLAGRRRSSEWKKSRIRVVLKVIDKDTQ